jgi:hypothetical protein
MKTIIIGKKQWTRDIKAKRRKSRKIQYRGKFQTQGQRAKVAVSQKPQKCLISNQTLANTIMCPIWGNVPVKALNLDWGWVQESIKLKKKKQ